MKLFCDNKVAIKIANNPMQHNITKYVEIDRHFIRERLDNGSIYISYILSNQSSFDSCISKLGLFYIYLPT